MVHFVNIYSPIFLWPKLEFFCFLNKLKFSTARGHSGKELVMTILSMQHTAFQFSVCNRALEPAAWSAAAENTGIYITHHGDNMQIISFASWTQLNSKPASCCKTTFMISIYQELPQIAHLLLVCNTSWLTVKS